MRWAEKQRIKYLSQILAARGFVNRADLMSEFGISMPQASLDIRTFLRLHPEAMQYNLSRKRYERS